MNPKIIEQLEKAYRMNDALYNKIAMGEVSLKKAGVIYDRQIAFETIMALKGVLEELKPQKNMLGEEI
jgi:hypothetical protein